MTKPLPDDGCLGISDELGMKVVHIFFIFFDVPFLFFDHGDRYPHRSARVLFRAIWRHGDASSICCLLFVLSEGWLGSMGNERAGEAV